MHNAYFIFYYYYTAGASALKSFDIWSVENNNGIEMFYIIIIIEEISQMHILDDRIIWMWRLKGGLFMLSTVYIIFYIKIAGKLFTSYAYALKL